MKLTLIFFGFCFLNHVNGDCDTERFVSPNLKFLKIVTKGTYQVRKSDRAVKDGQEVYLYCSNKTYLYDTVKPSKVVCENSIFDRNLPACYPSCDEPVFDASTTTIQCTSTDCNGRQIIGTEVEIFCRPGFKLSKRDKNKITCSDSGWNYPLYSCGTDNEQIKQVGFLYGGREASGDTAPWNVGIYKRNEQNKKNYDFICGGSIISQQLVATAGHCFLKHGKALNKYKVVVGSIKSEYDDQEGQHFNITHVEMAKDIEIGDYLKNDFAIALLDQPVKNPTIVKMPRDRNIFSFGAHGTLAGFGVTEHQALSTALLYTTLIIKECGNYTRDLCFAMSTTNVKKINKCLANPPPSKAVFCPKHKDLVSAPCEGDSGGGLVVEKNGKLYLAGLVSGVHGIPFESCSPENEVIFSDATGYYDLYEKALKREKSSSPSTPSASLQQKRCPGSDVLCGKRCIALEDLCTDECNDIPAKDQCKLRAAHQMLITGLNLLKFIGSQRDFTSYTFPNWVVPSASLWSLFNFFSEASDTDISNQLQHDFGVTPDFNVNDGYKKRIANAHIVSSASYTRNDILPNLFKEHFRHVRAKPQRDDWFYSATEDRVTTVLDYDFNHSFQYLGKRLEFVTHERQTIDTVMICSVSDHKILKWENFADVIDVAINASTRLMMIKPEDPRESLDSVMNALKKWPIRDLRSLAKENKQVGVCFPRFKVLIDTDYSPILFKMGYDYLFTPTRIDLTNVGATNVRIQTQVRAFIKIWDAENDYDDPTAPYDFDISNHAIVDKPFVFILYDSKTNLPWIVGKVNNPGMFRHYTSSASSYKLFP